MSKAKKNTSAKAAKVKSAPLKTQSKTNVSRASIAPANAKRDGTKVATIVAMLRRPKGASVEEMAKAAGWQQHSVRGLISGSIKKRLALDVVSEMIDGKRRYRIAAPLAV